MRRIQAPRPGTIRRPIPPSNRRSLRVSRALFPTLLLGVAALLHPERAAAFACSWTGAVSTAWATAGNWSSCNSTIPQPADTVTISSGGNQPVISTSVSPGQITLNSGASLTVTAAGSLSLTTTFYVSGSFTNSGDVTLSSSGDFYMQTGGSVTNQSGATIEIQHNTYAFYGSVAGLNVTNTGTITRTTSVGTAYVYNVHLVNTSPGTISVTSGILDLQNSGSSTHTGSFTSSGATLQFNGSATNTISGAVTGTNVIFTGSQTTTMTGTYNVTNTTIAAGTVNFNQAATVTFPNLTMTSGTIAGSANFNITTLFDLNSGAMAGTGTTTLANGATGTFDSSSLTLSRPFVNAGAITFSAGGFIYMQAGSSFTNQNSGTVEIQHNSYSFYGSVAGLNVTNTGSITRTTLSGTAYIYNVHLTNTSPGTISVTSGTLDLQNTGSSTHTGAFSAPGATLQFNGSATNTISGAVTGLNVIFTGSQTTTLTGTYTVTNTTVAAGTVNFNQASTVSLPNLTMTSGTLAGSANINVTTLLHVTSGTMAGTGTTTLANGGTGTLDSSNLGLLRPFVNAGAFTLSSSGDFYLQAGSSFTNQSTGTIEIQHNSYAFYGSPAGLIVTNTGSITRTTAVGTAYIYNVKLVNTSPGTISVTTGTLDLQNTGSSTHTGAFNATGATLQFNGSATNTISSAVTGTNVIFTGSQTTTLTGTYTVTNTTIAAGTVNFNQASAVSMPNLTMTSGTLGGSANVNVTTSLHVSSGTMAGTGTTTLANGGTGILDSSGLTFSRPFVNAGAFTLSGSGDFSLQSGATFTNQSTGTIDIQHNTYAFYGGVAGLPVTNTGSITRTTSSGTAYIYNVVLTNTSPGAISVTTGTLDLQNSGTSTHTGSFSASGATLQFNGSATNTVSGGVTGTNVKFMGSQTTTLTGTYNVTNTTISGGTVNFNEGSTVTMPNLTMVSGTLGGSANVNVTTLLDVNSGAMTGNGTTTLAGGATGTFDSSALSLSRPFVNAGAITFSNSGYVSMQTGGSFANQSGATLEIQHNTYAFYGNVAGLPVTNAGSVARTTGAGTAYIYNVPFTNSGTVTVQSGTLSLYDYTQTAGSTSLAGGDISSSPNPLRIQGGTLSGAGTITGNVLATAGAVVSPGSSPGQITITGNYTQSPPAAFNVELSGTGAGQFDQIAASGSATIGGTLNVSLLGFSPSAGNTFPVLTYASHVGNFGTLNLPALAGGLSWLPRYGATAFSLRVQALLPTLPLRVDEHAPSAGSPNLNHVLDPGERVLVEPTWHNPTTGPIGFTGTASNFTGPAGATYTINKTNAGYGTVTQGASTNCFSASGSCYELSVDNPFTRPSAHWDATFDETASNGDVASWTIHIGKTFNDVLQTAGQYRFIETLAHNQITAGCGGGAYCPTNTVSRGQMAVFLLKSKFGAAYLPPAATGTVFNDVPANNGFAPFIENLATLGVTSGCGSGNYCPNNPTTRAQMAVFLLRTLEGIAYTPPACATPTFPDVPCSSGFSRWVNELALRGITAGCGGGLYCPTASVTRGQMAVFLTTTFSLILNGP